jgi:transposase
MLSGRTWSRCCPTELRGGAAGGLITGWSSMRCSGGLGPVHRGGIFRRSTAIGRPSTTATSAGRRTARGRPCWTNCAEAPTWPTGHSGRWRSTRQSSARTSTRPALGALRRPYPTQGVLPVDQNHADVQDREALGRSRGGVTTKIHLVADSRSRPLARVLTAGQRHDSIAFVPVLASLAIGRCGRGRPRTRPDRVLADKAYSNKAIRAHLSRRGIRATIPEPSDQQAGRARRGSRGGRPPTFDAQLYKQRNTAERCVNKLKTYRAVATRYDKREYMFQGTVDVACIRIWLKDPVQ